MIRTTCELEKIYYFHLDKLCIIERLCHCKGGNFNIYNRAWFHLLKKGNQVLSIW